MRPNARLAALALAATCCVPAQGNLDSGTSTPADAGPADASTPDAGASDAGTPDGGTRDAGAAPVDGGAALSRGLAWVRNNPMFISGLNVEMPGADASAATDYFDTFHANAVHLWETGLPAERNDWLSARPGIRWVSWVDPSGKSLSNGQLLGGDDAGVSGRIGYQVSDEPNTQQQFDQIVSGVAAVRAADPDALTIINYPPAPDAGMLDQHALVAHADIYSYDNYDRGNDAYASLAEFRAAGLRHGLPYWRYLRMYINPGGSPQLDDSDCRWDAFAGLIYGFTGHTWFVYQSPTNPQFVQGLFAAPGDFSAAKTPAFALTAQLNLELRNLGRAITQLTSTDVRYIASSPLSQPPATQPWSAGAGGDPFITSVSAGAGSGLFPELLVGFFVDDAGERYVAVQNVRHTDGHFPVNQTQPLVARVDFDFGTGAVDPTNVLSLDPISGAVVPLPLTSQGGTAAQLSATLGAGNLILFKYATGSPFTLGP
jgi:hypothetical protein